MPIAPQLQRFVDDELSRSSAFASRILAGTLQLLREGRDSSLDASERNHHIELLAALQKQAELYQSTLIESLRALVIQELEGSASDPASDIKAAGYAGLELMDESLVDVDIEISRAMQLIDATAEWELRELQTFTSALIGQVHVSTESSPFRPWVYATALWQAACAIATAHVQRATVLRLSSGVAAGLLKSAWAAAATRLEAQGVEPSAYRTVVFSGSAVARTPAVDITRPGALNGLLSSMPARPPGEDRRPEDIVLTTPSLPGKPGDRSGRSSAPARGPAFEETLQRIEESLSKLPMDGASRLPQPLSTVPQLAHHRSALLAAATTARDRQIIELLARLFEKMLSDSRLPPRFRAVIARLQVAVLRVAVRDPAMTDTYNHPVWQLIDRIGEICMAYPLPDDPRLIALTSTCQTLAAEIAAATAPDATTFRRALNHIDAFLAEQLQTQLRAAQTAVSGLEMAERHSILGHQLSQRLTDEMATLRTSPGMRRFVTGIWAKVLAEAMLRFGENAEPTQVYLKTVDDLLWSLQTPDHPQSRQRLLTLLPTLLQRLRAGMALIALPRPEQQAILDELMSIHAEALRPGARKTTAAQTPEEIVQQMREETVADSPRGRPFSDSVIDLSSMETVPADVLETPDDANDESRKRIEHLHAAERMRMFIHGRWARCQLMWRSSQGLFFLFAGESPTRTHTVTRGALERLSAAGLILSLEPKPLLQRAVDQLTREVSALS